MLLLIRLNLCDGIGDKGGFHIRTTRHLNALTFAFEVVMSEGWISLHRKLTDWEWYNDHNTCRLFIHLLLKANHNSQKWQGKLIKRSQRLTSLKNLSQEVGLTVQQVRTSIKKLKSTNEITSEGSNKNTIITIVNYELYQSNNMQNNKRTTNEQQTNNKQITTNNNDNNNNNNNNISSTEQKSSAHSLFKKLNAVDLSDEWLDEPLPPDNVIEMWNEIIVGDNQAKKHVHVTKNRIDHINRRNEDSLLTGKDWLDYFKLIKDDKFCMGDKGWKATIDWALKPSNIIKMLEGGYNV